MILYTDKFTRSMTLIYKEGRIHTIQANNVDFVVWDGLKHRIEMFEVNINSKYWTKLD